MAIVQNSPTDVMESGHNNKLACSLQIDDMITIGRTEPRRKVVTLEHILTARDLDNPIECLLWAAENEGLVSEMIAWDRATHQSDNCNKPVCRHCGRLPLGN